MKWHGPWSQQVKTNMDQTDDMVMDKNINSVPVSKKKPYLKQAIIISGSLYLFVLPRNLYVPCYYYEVLVDLHWHCTLILLYSPVHILDMNYLFNILDMIICHMIHNMYYDVSPAMRINKILLLWLYVSWV